MVVDDRGCIWLKTWDILSWNHKCFFKDQFVAYNGVKSHYQFIKCGVPQESIPGRLLFLQDINDRASVCQCTFPILFANSGNLFIGGNNADWLWEPRTMSLKKLLDNDNEWQWKCFHCHKLRCCNSKWINNQTWKHQFYRKTGIQHRLYHTLWWM